VTTQALTSINGQKYKNLPNFDLLGGLEIRVYKKSDFYCKRHILAWIHVVRAILHEGPLWGLTPRVQRGKVRKSRTPIGMMCRPPLMLALPRSLW